jgi:hypothetical protein
VCIKNQEIRDLLFLFVSYKNKLPA